MAVQDATAVVEPSLSYGSPIVLLHGLTGSARVWDAVRPLLNARSVFVPTLPGHRGGQPLDSSPATVQAIADGVCRQLDEQGIACGHLVGNSLDGCVALELARRGRAESVVAFSPAGGWTRRSELHRLQILFKLGALVGTSRAARRLAGHPIGRRALFRPLQPFTASPCPTLLAWGDRDRIAPVTRLGAQFQRCVPGIATTILPGVGHVPMSDDPHLVADTILDWVSAAESTGAVRALRPATGGRP